MVDLQVKAQRRIKHKTVNILIHNFDDCYLWIEEVKVETYHSQIHHLIDWRRHGLQESSENFDIK